MPVPSIITSAKAAAKAYRLRVSIESIVQGIEASRLRTGDVSHDLPSSEDSAIVDRIFRNESFVTDLDRRYDTASRYERIVLGDDRIALDEMRTHIRGKVVQQYGERSRAATRFKRTTDDQETFLVGNRYEETVHGPVTLTAKYSAEAIVGGTYINTITCAYLRIAGWIDCMAWGGWVEADAIRCEIALLMIHSYVGYAHATVARLTLASRMVDDFVNKYEMFGVRDESGVNRIELGGPGSGIENEA